MKYERITEHHDRPLVMSMWAGDSKSLQAYNRLAELEDKIESGEFIPAAEYESARHRAEVAERALLWLCDETMRDIRIIMYPTLGKQVRDKQELYDYCIEQAENAELRERLDKAIEPPVKIGDTIYEVCKACDEPCECKYYTRDYPVGAECHAPSLPYGCSCDACYSTDIVNEECKKHLCVEKQKFNLRFLDDKTGELKPQYFINEKVAQAKLEELQGGRSNGTYKGEKPNNKEIS